MQRSNAEAANLSWSNTYNELCHIWDFCAWMAFSGGLFISSVDYDGPYFRAVSPHVSLELCLGREAQPRWLPLWLPVLEDSTTSDSDDYIEAFGNMHIQRYLEFCNDTP